MFLRIIVTPIIKSRSLFSRKCHSVFGLQDLLSQYKTQNFELLPATSKDYGLVVEAIKKHYLTEHVLVRERKMDLMSDQAFDEFLISIVKQGNTLYAKAEDGSLAGICINFACSAVDPRNLRNYAFYRQDPNTKDFLYYTAKLQETPNLWELFKEPKVFEIKMLAVLPEYRRQGLAVQMVNKAMDLAHDQNYKVVRMDCINRFDYKIAERCRFQYLLKFPIYKLRGNNAPFIKRKSENNVNIRVYVNTQVQTDKSMIKNAQNELESTIE